MNSWRMLVALVAAMGLVTLTSCRKGDDGAGPGKKDDEPTQQQDEPLPKEKAAFEFKLSSYGGEGAPAGALRQALVGLGQALGVRRIEGQLLSVPHKHEDEREVLYFEIEVDEGALEVRTVVNLDLPTRAYDFFFLLKAGGTSYGGIVRDRLIIEGAVNPVTMTLNPILGALVESVEDFRALVPVVVRYNPVTLASYAQPRIGVSLDGGPEFIFSIRVNADSPQILLYPPPGRHSIRLRFFDGAIVKDVTPEPEPIDTGPGAPPVEVVVVPLTAGVAYTFTETAPAVGTATFDFTVPVDVIAEVGGAGTPASPLEQRLKTVVSVVGPENALSEQELLLTPVLNADGAIVSYAGRAILANFVPGKVTWQISFVDRTTLEEYAYCAETVDTTDTPTPNQGGYVCDLNLLVRALEAGAPTGTVRVTITDQLGLVSGAVVLIDGQPIGIAGGSDPGEPLGELSAFLSPGTYTLQVVDEVVDPFGSRQIFTRSTAPQEITVTAKGTALIAITLPPFSFAPPQVSGTSVPNGTLDVPIDVSIAITFSHPMNRATTQNALRINGAVPVGRFDWSAGDKVMTFTPATVLAYLQTYVVTVLASATDTYFTPIPAAFGFEFTTGTHPDYQAPRVNDVTPADGTLGVPLDEHGKAKVTVTFSEAMDTGSVGGAFALKVAATGQNVPGELSWSGSNAVATFLPSVVLAYNTAYTVSVDQTARDPAGNPLSPAFGSVFTTGEQPDLVRPHVAQTFPSNGAAELGLNTHVVVSFSEPMDPGTVEKAFLMQRGSIKVGGSFTWGGSNSVATFAPGEALDYDTLYRVTVGQGARDLTGNALLEPLDVSFRTLAPPPPPPGRVLKLTASRFFRHRDYKDGYIDIDEPIAVRIPPLANVQVVRDGDGKPIGDPNRFLLFLYLGEVRCMYLAGKWDKQVGGLAEKLFENAFNTPVCNRGPLGANDVVTVVPDGFGHGDDDRGWKHDWKRDGKYGRYYLENGWKVLTQFFSKHDGKFFSKFGQNDLDRDGKYFDDDDGDDKHRDDDHDRERRHRDHPRAEIRARVINANPHYSETRVEVTIEVVKP